LVVAVIRGITEATTTGKRLLNGLNMLQNESEEKKGLLSALKIKI
jgi:hypothetical protein